MKTLAELKEELAIHQQNLNSDLIKNNDDLRESLEQKIEEMITKIENYSGDEEPAPVVEAEPEFEPVVKKKKVVEEKPIVEKAPKPKAEPKEKEEKPIKTKEPKRKEEKPAKKQDGEQNDEGLAYFESKFKIGQSVQFEARGFDKKLTGKLKSLKNTKQEDGTYSVNAFVELKDGSVKKVRASKLI